MRIKTVISASLLCLGLITAAQGDVISQAYEVALSDFRAPETENGSAAYRECETCEQRLVRVTANTRYAVSGNSVKLEDFKKSVVDARSRDTILVIVVHHLESDTIKSIDVSL